MFSHMGLGVNDVKKSIVLYDGIMEVLGYSRHSTSDSWAGYGDPSNAATGYDSLWIGIPYDGEAATSGNGAYVALNTSSRKNVDTVYQRALDLGASDEGKPGIRAEAHPNFYAAYIRDFDGNKLAFVCHDPK